jgi:2-methylcitrate dehydratase PrpD
MDNYSEKVAAHVARTRFVDLPEEAVASARGATLDTLAAMVAGSRAPGLETMVELARGWGGRAEATVIARNLSLPAPVAAWLNGTMARALEIDDCVDFLPVHPSASAVPALLALAQAKGGLSGRDFITALAVGQDLIIRVGLALKHNAMETGRNNLFKIFGPTAAVARGLGLSSEKTLQALGISFAHAVGDGQGALDGALSLRLQQGLVAQGALLSGLLAEKGFTGAREFLMGRWGYLRVWEPEPRLEYLDSLGDEFMGARVSVKPFSSCRATHPALDLTLSLIKEHDLNPKDIKAVRVRVSPEMHNLVGSPHEAKIKPDSVPAAQFSLQYTVAAAIQRGDVFLAELEPEVYADPEILGLAGQVEVIPDQTLRTGAVLGRTRVALSLAGSGVLEAETEHPLGSPAKPLGDEARVDKFRKCAARAARPIPARTVEEAIGQVEALESLPDVAILAESLAG